MPRRSAWPLVLGCALLFAFLAVQVLLQGPVVRLDARITQWFVANRQDALTSFMLFVANAHETVLLLAATALVAAWRGWRRDFAAWRLLAVVPAGMTLNVALKHTFDRARPVLDEPLVHLSTYSFPSGHAVASTVFYGALCALALAHLRTPGTRAVTAVVAVAMVLLVCACRVYLGAHFLSDVLAGVAVGTLCLVAFVRWWRR